MNASREGNNCDWDHLDQVFIPGIKLAEPEAISATSEKPEVANAVLKFPFNYPVIRASGKMLLFPEFDVRLGATSFNG